MPGGALFVGWGQVVRGREQQALQVFNETVEFWGQRQQQGEIDSFEPVALEPHGGDLSGFFLVRGDRDKLNRLRSSEEFLRIVQRAGLVVDDIGVVNGFVGDELNRLFAEFQQQAADIVGR